MKFIKLISLLLAVLTMAGALTMIVGAEPNNTETENYTPEYTTKTGNGKSLMKEDKGKYLYKEGIMANGTVITKPEEKISTMDLRFETASYRLYVDAYSGEVAIYSKVTGEYLFTNPYNIGMSTASKEDNGPKDELLSQIIINYSDIKTNKTGKMTSYKWSALLNQINVKNINNGIRVEYTLGYEDSRILLPYYMEASKFHTMIETIRTNMEAAIEAGKVSNVKDERDRLTKLESLYSAYTGSDVSEDVFAQNTTLFPILKENPGMVIYAIDQNALTPVYIKQRESVIKDYYPEYTYEMLVADHAECGKTVEEEEHPLFKLALEYTVDENSGLVVKLPANGIRFDETMYRLDNIKILPYMGAGMNPNTGYTFFPDGSGTLFRFEDIYDPDSTTEVSVNAKVYGADYAYHKLSGMYEEVIRYPVFGIYEEQKLQREISDGNGGTVTEDYTKGRGFVAIIEEGDALMELTTSHGGTHEYNTVIMSAMPRPTDSYNISDAVSVSGGENQEWTVVSARKYTGSYTVRYIMLTDDETAAERGVDKYYETSYVGMAKAYREYLERNGMLTRLTGAEGEDIPLYIETFGALQTTEKFLSIPIKVMTPLTTFDNVKTMYEDLKNQGITNVNFILTGYTKGGLTGESVPYKLKWEKSVSKEMKYEELNEYARANGFGVFPDFDFVFATSDKAFDGLNLKKHAAKTIDSRYTSKREYSATKHTYVSYYELALSSAYFSHFYEKFVEKFQKYNPVGISVSTLGSYLNSDFDEDEPYNRADSKTYTVNAFDYINTNLPNTEILTSGGNAYCWKFVDHITDISLDSSRYAVSSASVPFLGMVLHGYVDIAGTPVNMEGNLDYAFLKAIESGASLKFILSYQNIAELKEYETLSRYYSVDYSIWFDQGKGDLVSMYRELNNALKGVRYSLITGHEFINNDSKDVYAYRVPDLNEIKLDADQAIKDAIAYETAMKNAQTDAERKAIYEARQLIVKGEAAIRNAVTTEWAEKIADQIDALKAIYNGTSGEYATLLEEANATLVAYQTYQQYHAIHTDLGGKSLTYNVSTAIEAYDAHMRDTANEDLKTAYEKAKSIVGEAYLMACIEERDAKAALDAYTESSPVPKEELEATYNAAKATREGMSAGALDYAAISTAMAELEPYKQAWINASKGTDADATAAAKDAFNAKVKEIYKALVDDVYYQINYNGELVGGSQWERNNAKSKYEAAARALDEKLKELYAETKTLFEEVELFMDRYNLDKLDEALAYLEETNAYTEAERNELKSLILALKEDLADDNLTYIMNAIVALKDYDMNGVALKAYEGYLAHYELSDAAGVEIKLGVLEDYEPSGHKASTYLTQTEYTWTEKYVDTKPEPEQEAPATNKDKYKPDANSIVHETFDNGTEFILNFNDYAVVVVLNGVQYTLDAFGYVVINAKA